MPTAWTLPTQEIIVDAMQIIGVLGADEAVSAEDSEVCMRTLQNILKELPIHGLSWPKMTVAPTSLVWSALTPAQVPMPADYFGVPQVSFTQNSANVDLHVITKQEYDELLQPDVVALYPKSIYIAPNSIGYLWPVPSADPALKITYQAIVLDATATAQPDVVQSWIGGLGLWLAYEICPKFQVPMQERQDIERRFIPRRRMMLAYAAETAPICLQVAE